MSGDPKYDEAEGRMDDSDVSDEESVQDLTEDISHLRKWDEEGARKRSAKDVASDMTLPEAERMQAKAWMQENAERRKKGKARQTTCRKQALQQRRGEAAQEERGQKHQKAADATTTSNGAHIDLDNIGDDYGPLERHAATTSARVGARAGRRERGRAPGVRRQARR